ncbi:MAG TPA: HNH endonuclease [Anaerolineae bacterium]|nr:HNH endonuclease [Anaerolineae bacterium]
MKWDDTKQARLDALRAAELAGTLDEAGRTDMMISKTLRDTIRALYGFRCGYCGVTETESGGKLDIDHFRPKSHGGTDTLDNLVYACVTCNRLKGDYWPAPEFVLF